MKEKLITVVLVVILCFVWFQIFYTPKGLPPGYTLIKSKNNMYSFTHPEGYQSPSVWKTKYFCRNFIWFWHKDQVQKDKESKYKWEVIE